MKRMFLLLRGVAALIASAALLWFLGRYLAAGAGLQLVGTPGATISSVLIGWVHVLGLAFGSLTLFCLGIWWCADALVKEKNHP